MCETEPMPEPLATTLLSGGAGRRADRAPVGVKDWLHLAQYGMSGIARNAAQEVGALKKNSHVVDERAEPALQLLKDHS